MCPGTGIVAAGRERVAAQEAPGAEDEAAEEAAGGYGAGRVLGAGGVVATGGGFEGTEVALVYAHQADGDPGGKGR